MPNRKKLTVGNLMTTAVVTIRGGDQISDAEMEMKFAGVRHLPVLDDHHRVVGILSDRDVLRALRASRREQVRVGDVMTDRVETVRPGMEAVAALDLMLDLRISSLPVVGDDEQLVGVITTTDYLAVAQKALTGVSLLPA